MHGTTTMETQSTFWSVRSSPDMEPIAYTEFLRGPMRPVYEDEDRNSCLTTTAIVSMASGCFHVTNVTPQSLRKDSEHRAESNNL